MSMISELVDRLRIESASMGKYGNDYMATLLMRASDTIVMLSEKAKADTPQTDEEYINNLPWTESDKPMDEYFKDHEEFYDMDCPWK